MLEHVGRHLGKRLLTPFGVGHLPGGLPRRRAPCDIPARDAADSSCRMVRNARRTLACGLIAALALVSSGSRTADMRRTCAPTGPRIDGQVRPLPARPSAPPVVYLNEPATVLSAAIVCARPDEDTMPAPRMPRNEDSDMVRQLKAEFTSEGVPAELVWIAEVESLFNPKARSRTGALGLFQFKTDTARRFGLHTGRRDDRLDPLKSARAAARYLKTLYQRFGSWPLAVAAYNAGEERLARGMRARRAATFDAVAAVLPRETQEYVPRVMAIVGDREQTDPYRLPPPQM